MFKTVSICYQIHNIFENEKIFKKKILKESKPYQMNGKALFVVKLTK